MCFYYLSSELAAFSVWRFYVFVANLALKKAIFGGKT